MLLNWSGDNASNLQTNPIVIPEDSPVQKRLPRLHEIPSREETNIDTATLFYDVFLYPSTNCLIGLGPAF